MTEMLKPYFTSVVGMDIAEGMVDKYNATYASDPSVTGYVADLTSSQTPSPSPSPAAALGKEDNFADFDFIVVGMALHHFPDARLATRNLVDRLRPGGRILIVDWLVPGPGEEEEEESGVGELEFSTASASASGGEVISESLGTFKTHGFPGSEMRRVLVGAGCEEESVRVDVNEEGIDLPWGKGMRFFFAHGVKTS
ncbi:hypothetical protein KEM55_004641 [Ascosphaera atra]|nr:hypothetical protein KEM55_004641 [Ascosphaera atra]